MIDNILSLFFTQSVISAMGDYYTMIYSWSVFALFVLFCLLGAVVFYSVIRTMLRWLNG